MGVKRKQHSAEYKARVAMAALSGEKTLAELSAAFGVHPTMISNWKQELCSGRFSTAGPMDKADQHDACDQVRKWRRSGPATALWICRCAWTTH